MIERLAIDVLISDRCAQLGMSPIALVHRTGFKNTSKAMRRLEQLRRGDIAKTPDLIRALPAALDLPEEAITGAVEQTRLQLAEIERARAEKAEADWRAAFLPHAIVLTDRSTPQPIFVAAVIGVDRLLRINFDLTAGRASFVNQALNGIPTKLGNDGKIPAFGSPVGIAVNYSPDRAVRFDLTGKALEVLPRAERPGRAEFRVGGKPIPPILLGAV